MVAFDRSVRRETLAGWVVPLQLDQSRFVSCHAPRPLAPQTSSLRTGMTMTPPTGELLSSNPRMVP